jgi:hypothetical protein
MFQTRVPNVLSASDVCCIQVFHMSEVESHGARPRRQGMGCDKLGPASRVCLGPAVEVRGAPGVVRTGRARLVVLILAHGFRGKERAGAVAVTGRRCGSKLAEREEG